MKPIYLLIYRELLIFFFGLHGSLKRPGQRNKEKKTSQISYKEVKELFEQEQCHQDKLKKHS